VLQHYLAKEETQKTAHWCIVHTAQSNCCSAVDFLSPEPCPPTAPSRMHRLQDLGSHKQQREYALCVKEIEEIKQQQVEFWQCTNAAFE